MAENNGTNVGRVEQVTGVVIDAVFPDTLPEIYSAVKIEMSGGSDGETTQLVCEVQQHLGDDRVRAVAMDATDGIQRGEGNARRAAPAAILPLRHDPRLEWDGHGLALAGRELHPGETGEAVYPSAWRIDEIDLCDVRSGA